jgi:hypothetical protein
MPTAITAKPATTAIAAPAAALTPEQMVDFIKDPFLQLPKGWKPLVFDYWAFFHHLLEQHKLALCTRIRWFIDEDSLTFDELHQAMRMQRTPKMSKDYQFASQVMAGLSECIEAVRKNEIERVKKMKKLEEKESQRYEGWRETVGLDGIFQPLKGGGK